MDESVKINKKDKIMSVIYDDPNEDKQSNESQENNKELVDIKENESGVALVDHEDPEAQPINHNTQNLEQTGLFKKDLNNAPDSEKNGLFNNFQKKFQTNSVPDPIFNDDLIQETKNQNMDDEEPIKEKDISINLLNKVNEKFAAMKSQNNKNVGFTYEPKIVGSQLMNESRNDGDKKPGDLKNLEDKFNENFKKIIDSIVHESQNNNDLPDITGPHEKMIRKRMEEYFKNQNLDNMKQKLFFNRWTQILKEEDNEENQRQINFATTNREQDNLKDLKSKDPKAIKFFDKNSLKIVSSNPESSWSDEFEQQYIQPGSPLLNILPFCPTVVVLKKRKAQDE